ncbi:hypothetical protein [Halorussus ruber]|uniref:hypothetical protein n=1 Tax=Halorussus ruber TaxID=1126238 RepID=UPI0010929398|nr:hypothetical protein [Halorussus ruber]
MADALFSANTTVSTIGISLVVFVLFMLVRGLFGGVPVLGALINAVYYLSLLVLVASLGYFLYFSIAE